MVPTTYTSIKYYAGFQVFCVNYLIINLTHYMQNTHFYQKIVSPQQFN